MDKCIKNMQGGGETEKLGRDGTAKEMQRR